MTWNSVEFEKNTIFSFALKTLLRWSLSRMKLSIYKYNVHVILECRVKTERIPNSSMHIFHMVRIGKILFCNTNSLNLRVSLIWHLIHRRSSLCFKEILCTYSFFLHKIKLLGSVNTNTNIRGDILCTQNEFILSYFFLTNKEAIIFLPHFIPHTIYKQLDTSHFLS